MPFIGDIDVEVKQVDATNWELLGPLEYAGKFKPPFRVPKGMQTDFASVPRPFVWFIPRYGVYTRAAILHDYLWREHAAKGRLSWSDADGIFRRAMRELGVAFLRRWVIWAAVRAASLLTKRGGRRRSLADVAPALIFALLGFVIVSVPGVLILVALGAFYLLEQITWFGINVGRVFRGFYTTEPPDKIVNAPRLRLKL